MGRHERRALASAQRRGTVSGSEKAKVTFHQDPDSLTKEHLAMMLSLLTHAFTLGSKLPGYTFPIHLTVDHNGVSACATVEPSDGEPDDGPGFGDVCKGVH